jgi:hypothetical protein
MNLPIVAICRQSDLLACVPEAGGDSVKCGRTLQELVSITLNCSFGIGTIKLKICCRADINQVSASRVSET